MEKFNEFVAKTPDAKTQMDSSKNPMPCLRTDAFALTSSKADMFDHMKNGLQYFMPPYEMYTKVGFYIEILIICRILQRRYFVVKKCF